MVSTSLIVDDAASTPMGISTSLAKETAHIPESVEKDTAGTNSVKAVKKNAVAKKIILTFGI